MNKKKILILIDTKQYQEHRTCSAVLNKMLEELGEETALMDVSAPESDYDKYRKILEYRAEVMITFDLAGFGLRTETNTVTLNQIPCRMIHLLFRETADYGEVLRESFNFSMFFYAANEAEKMRLEKEYPNIENALCIPEAVRLAHDSNNDCSGQKAAWSAFYQRICLDAEL